MNNNDKNIWSWLLEDYDDPDYWSDKQGPTYLVLYKGEPKCYAQFPYAGDPARGGKKPSDGEVERAAYDFLNDAGIKCTNFSLLSGVVVRCVVFLVICVVF